MLKFILYLLGMFLLVMGAYHLGSSIISPELGGLLMIGALYYFIKNHYNKSVKHSTKSSFQQDKDEEEYFTSLGDKDGHLDQDDPNY